MDSEYDWRKRVRNRSIGKKSVDSRKDDSILLFGGEAQQQLREFSKTISKPVDK